MAAGRICPPLLFHLRLNRSMVRFCPAASRRLYEAGAACSACAAEFGPAARPKRFGRRGGVLLMCDSANLKIDRASKYVRDLSELIREQLHLLLRSPGERKDRTAHPPAQKEQTVIAQIALIGGDIIHNLRAALDHAYWEIVLRLPRTTASGVRFSSLFQIRGKAEEALKDRARRPGLPLFLQGTFGTRNPAVSREGTNSCSSSRNSTSSTNTSSLFQ